MYELNQEFRRGILFMRLSGEVTYVTADNLFEEIKLTIDNNGIKNLVLNFEKVFAIDKIGKNIIEKLINCFKNITTIYLCDPQNILGLDNHLVENELSALNLIKL